MIVASLDSPFSFSFFGKNVSSNISGRDHLSSEAYLGDHNEFEVVTSFSLSSKTSMNDLVFLQVAFLSQEQLELA